MPSDASPADVFKVLSHSLVAFRSAVATAIEQLRGQVESAERNGDPEEDGADLGRFAVGRIDADRFAAVAQRDAVAVEPATRDRISHAYEVLRALADRKERLFGVDVPSGGSLVGSVSAALDVLGRAFGAARVAELSRLGRFHEDRHAAWLDAFPFVHWNRAERSIAPVLVVDVDGGDVQADGLAAFLDGTQKILLRVRGDAPVAPLARLVTPGVFVAQVKDAADLAAFAAFDGPGVAALLPASAALFVHDPTGGETLGDRLQVQHVPAQEPTQRLGGLSVNQQVEPLRQLKLLGEATPQHAGAEEAAVEKLTAWLLSQTDVRGL